MLRGRRFKLVVNPESVNELYDLEAHPSDRIEAGRKEAYPLLSITNI